MYRMKIPYSLDQLNRACIEIVKINGFRDAYIRPVVYRGYGSLGVDPRECPVETAILAWQWGAYLGEEAIEQGVDVRISSWQRLAQNTMPPLSKCGANYMNSQLIKLEAVQDGYVEGIALNTLGYIAEGSGENLFLIRDGMLYTPPLSDWILPGITRNSVIRLAEEMKIEVREISLPREMIYIADEAFFTGTAAEITPIRSVDRIPVGKGERGEITKKIQEQFFGILTGGIEDRFGWLDFVE
jgi:branched-chain amino acid aminotransferase